MNDEELDGAVRSGALGPVPLAPEAEARLRARLRVEVANRRAAVAEGVVHGGFALAAVVWAIVVLLPR